MEMGGAKALRPTTERFLNRLVQAAGDDPRSAASPSRTTDARAQGPAAVPTWSLRGGARNPMPQGEGERISAHVPGHAARGGRRRGDRDAAPKCRSSSRAEMADRRARAGPARRSRAARVVGRLMTSKAAYRSASFDVGGWDTHVDQGATQGALAKNLEVWRRGWRRSARRWAALWASTVVVVCRVRAHGARERQPRHRPRARQHAVGAAAASRRQDRGAQGPVDEAHLYQTGISRCSRLPLVLGTFWAHVRPGRGADRARPARSKAQSYGLI